MRTIPYNEAPDEMDQYAVCEFIGKNGRLPIFGKDMTLYWLNNVTKQPLTEREIAYFKNLPADQLKPGLFSLRVPYILHPYLSYILSGFLIKCVNFFSTNPYHFLVAARLISAISGALTALLTYKIAMRLFINRFDVAVLSAVFVGVLPQMTFTNSYVNSDAFSAMSATLIFLMWLKCLDSWKWQHIALLGCALGLLGLSKINTYSILILTGIFLSGYLRAGWKNNLRIIGTIMICAFAVSGWYFVRNKIIYNFFFMPHININEFLAQSDQVLLKNMAQHKLEISNFSILSLFLKWSFESFVGRFGWMNIRMPQAVYQIFLILIVSGIAGFMKSYSAAKFKSGRHRSTFMLMCSLFFLLFVMSLFFSIIFDFQAQGRYLFPAIAPFAIALSIGWLSISNKAAVTRLSFISILALLIGINIFSFVVCIVNCYYF